MSCLLHASVALSPVEQDSSAHTISGPMGPGASPDITEEQKDNAPSRN